MKSLETLRNVINKILCVATSVIFALMVCIGTYQIATRYFFGSPSTVSEELLTYSFTWLALLAAAYVFGKRDHMRMGFLADKATGGLKTALSIMNELLTMLLAGSIMLYGGFTIIHLTMTQKTASLGISMGVIYTILPISGILIFIYGILNIIDLANGIDRTAALPAEEINKKEGKLQ